MEAKARWFQSLSMEERMDALCAFTDLALTLNPRLPDLKDAQQTQGRIRLLSVDLEDVRLLKETVSED